MSETKKSMKDLVRDAKSLTSVEQDSPRPGPGDEFYTPPVAAVTLPSRGLVYPPGSPLFDTQVLEVRAMCASDEDIMTSAGLLRRGKMLSALMRACVVNRTIDADQMLIGDRNAVMIAIRNSSYGPEYDAEVVCPSCGEKSQVTFDLSRLSMKTLDVEPDGGTGNNLFSFTLPVTKKTVEFRLITASSAHELDQILEAQRKAKGPGAAEENVTQGLIHQIVGAQGVDARNLPRFVRSMPVRDSRALRGYIDKISPSVDMEQEAECTSCGSRAAVEVPLTAEFFWPKA
jgi:hypothetical protein